MSWKQAAGLLVIVFVLALIQAVVAGPLVELQNTLLDFGNYNNAHFNGERLIKNLVSSWFNMILLGIFLLFGVTGARIVRKELSGRRRRS